MVQQNWFQFCNFLWCLKTLWNGTRGIATSLRIISVIIDHLSINIVGYLNEWIKDSQNLGHQVFLGADSKFLDAVADPELSPLSQDKWNLWMQCSASEKGKVDPSTGLRTDLNLSFDCPLPKSLLPALTGDHILMCIDHGFTRVAENLIMKVVRTCLDLESRLVY